jgi:hypothetical protein
MLFIVFAAAERNASGLKHLPGVGCFQESRWIPQERT